jgi:hypothetical protein
MPGGPVAVLAVTVAKQRNSGVWVLLPASAEPGGECCKLAIERYNQRHGHEKSSHWF